MKNITHHPIRSCASCGHKLPKRSMIRIVSTPSGSVEVDINGKRSGRGAYICPQIRCWTDAINKTTLDHCLHTTLTTEQREMLSEYFKGQNQAIEVSKS